MKKFKTDCDIGSVLIGNEAWTFAVPNYGGDGTTTVVIFNSDEEFAKSGIKEKKKLDFISSAQGRFGIFGYDCDYHELMRGEMTLDDAVCVLSGRYGVYRGEYIVVFVKWNY